MTARPPLIPLSKLQAQSRHAGHAYRLHSRHAHQGFALRGRVETHAMPHGATLHLVDVQDLHEQEVDLQLKPGLRIVWVLQGCADVQYGPHRMQLGPQAPGAGRRPMAQAVALSEPESFKRRATAGGRETTVSLCLTPEWLGATETSVPLSAQHLARTHLQCRQWAITQTLHRLLLSLLAEPVMQPELHALYLQGCFQMLASHALNATTDGGARKQGRGTAPRSRQMKQLRELLDSGEARHWSLQELARQHHMSAATLQRHFQQAHGMSVFEYQRQARLRQARDALVKGELNVAQAATLAGYRHASNFCTAFHRQFGFTPAQARHRRN